MEAEVVWRDFQQSSFKVGRLPAVVFHSLAFSFLPACNLSRILVWSSHHVKTRQQAPLSRKVQEAWTLCWFPRAPITKNLRLSGLKQWKRILSLLWKLEV